MQSLQSTSRKRTRADAALTSVKFTCETLAPRINAAATYIAAACIYIYQSKSWTWLHCPPLMRPELNLSLRDNSNSKPLGCSRMACTAKVAITVVAARVCIPRRHRQSVSRSASAQLTPHRSQQERHGCRRVGVVYDIVTDGRSVGPFD